MRRIITWTVALGLLAVLGGLKPLRADERGGQKDVTLTGEVIDTYCYAAMGAKGASHRECGLGCAKAGIPVGLLEAKTNQVYVLLPNADKTAVPEAAIQKMGQKATIKGHAYTVGGSRFLTVEAVE